GRVVEDAKEAVDAHVDARGLHERLVVGVDPDPTLLEQPPDRPVGEDHEADSKAVACDADQKSPCRLCRLGRLKRLDFLPLSMAEQDSNARYRERRRQRRRRQVRIRRTVAACVLLALAAGITLGARAVGGSGGKQATASAKGAPRQAPTPG